MEPLLVGGSGLGGAILGLAADRLAARWPAHEDGRTRAVDWRTPVVAAAGGLAAVAAAARFGDDPLTLAYLAPIVVGLVVLFATDLDQRLLPDILTLPLVPYAVAGTLLGAGPFVTSAADLVPAAVAAVLVPLGLYALSIPFGAGAIGLGDLKLLVGVGLLVGPLRLVAALVVGAVAAGLVIAALLVTRRITLRTYVPYGPFLILGTLWVVVGRAL